MDADEGMRSPLWYLSAMAALHECANYYLLLYLMHLDDSRHLDTHFLHIDIENREKKKVDTRRLRCWLFHILRFTFLESFDYISLVRRHSSTISLCNTISQPKNRKINKQLFGFSISGQSKSNHVRARDSFHHNFIVDVSSQHLLPLLPAPCARSSRRVIEKDERKNPFNNFEFEFVKYKFRSDDICFVSYFVVFFSSSFIIYYFVVSYLCYGVYTMYALLISVGLEKRSEHEMYLCGQSVPPGARARKLAFTTSRYNNKYKNVPGRQHMSCGAVAAESSHTEKKKTNYLNLINEKIINK